MKKAKDFEGLLPSEIKKACRAAEKAIGEKCEVGGYEVTKTDKVEFAPEYEFVYVWCEIDKRADGRRANVEVTLTIPMFDRRMTKAHVK